MIRISSSINGINACVSGCLQGCYSIEIASHHSEVDKIFVVAQRPNEGDSVCERELSRTVNNGWD